MGSSLDKEAEKLIKKGEKLYRAMSYKNRLSLMCFVFDRLREQLNAGASFRHLIYDLFEFDVDAYVPLHVSGGMDISNALFETWCDNNHERINELINNRREEVHHD